MSSILSVLSDSARPVDSFWWLAGTYLALTQTTLSESLKPVEGIILNKQPSR